MKQVHLILCLYHYIAFFFLDVFSHGQGIFGPKPSRRRLPLTRSMYERLLREILRCTAKEHEGTGGLKGYGGRQVTLQATGKHIYPTKGEGSYLKIIELKKGRVAWEM